MNLLLLTILFGVVGAQTTSSGPTSGGRIFPAECQTILDKSVASVTYPPTSVANAFNTFCPVINELADCLEKNLGNSNTPMQRILAENFNKDLIKSRMTSICNLLPTVASDLQCLTNVTEINECVQQQSAQLNQPGLTLTTLCNTMTVADICFRSVAVGKCPDVVLDFYTAYQYVFMPPQCQSTFQSDVSSPESVVLSCARDYYSGLLNDVFRSTSSIPQPADIARIIFESFEDICQNRSVFAACVQERFVPPLSQVDLILDQLLNPNSIGPALDQICQASLSPSEEKCLMDSTLSMVFCGGVFSNLFSGQGRGTTGGSFESQNSGILQAGNGNSFTPYTVNPVTGSVVVPPMTGNVAPDFVQYLCPSINSMNTCVGIQLQRCSTSLGQTFTNVKQQLLSAECLAAKSNPQVNAYPLGSVLTYCGLGLGGEIFTRFSRINGTNREQREQTTFDIIRDLIPVGCGFTDFYSSCIARELPNSPNTMDKIALKLLDLTNAGRLQKVFKAVCDETKEIQDNIYCLAQNLNGSEVCVNKPEYQPLFRKYSNITAIDINTITEVCGPIKEIGLCGANLMSRCSEVLGKLGMNLVKELLRTDCGGERPLTGNPNTAVQNIPLPSFYMLFVLIGFFLL